MTTKAEKETDYPPLSAASALYAAGLTEQYANMFVDITLPFTLKPHQIEGLNYLLYYERVGLYAQARTGKTIVFILYALYCARFGSKSVITMPPILFDQFQDQWHDLKGDLPSLHLFDHTPAKRRKLFLQWDQEGSHPDLLVMTKEIFKKELDTLVKHYEILIVDESHTALQSEKTQMFSATQRFLDKDDSGRSPRLVLSTGTPVSTGLEGAYPAIELVTPGAYYNREHFDAMHVVFKKIKRRDRRGREVMIPVPAHYVQEDLLYKNLYKQAIRVVRDEVLSFTKPYIQPFNIHLDRAHMRMYKKFMRERVVELEDRLISARQEAKLLSLSSQMIVSPHLYSDSATKVKNNLLAAVHQVRDMVGVNAEDKCIIFANYRTSVETIQSSIPGAVSVYGGNSKAKNTANVKLFTGTSAKCTDIVINPQAGGVGLTLPMATLVIFAEVPASYGIFEQALSRAIVGGKTKPTLVYLMRVLETTHAKSVTALLKGSEPVRLVNGDKRTLLSEFQL